MLEREKADDLHETRRAHVPCKHTRTGTDNVFRQRCAASLTTNVTKRRTIAMQCHNAVRSEENTVMSPVETTDVRLQSPFTALVIEPTDCQLPVTSHRECMIRGEPTSGGGRLLLRDMARAFWSTERCQLPQEYD